MEKDQEKVIQEYLDTCCPCGVLHLRMESGYPIQYVSKPALHLLGYSSREEFFRENKGVFINTIHPDERAMVRNAVENQLQYQQFFEVSHRVQTESGLECWIQIRGRCVTDGHAQKMIVVSFLDVTEQKIREEERLKRQQIISFCRLNLTWKLIEECRVRGHNVRIDQVRKMEQYQQSLNLFLEEPYVLEGGMEDLSVESLLRAYHSGQHTISKAFIAKLKTTGEYRWFQIECKIMRRLVDNNVVALLMCQDITRHHISEKAIGVLLKYDYDFAGLILKESKQFYLLSGKEQVSHTYTTVDYDREVERVYRACVVSSQLEQLVQSVQLTNICRQLEKESFYMVEVDMRQKNGEVRKKQLRFAYADRKLGIISITRIDITAMSEEEKQKREQLKNALTLARSASAAKSEFLATVSHEVRTPLNVIIGMTRIAIDEKQPDSKVLQSYLNKIHVAGCYLLNLVNDVLDMSKIESGEFSLCPEVCLYEEFQKEMYSIIGPMCEEKKITFIESGNAQHHPIILDKLRFNQVLFNLLFNAVKFTPKGGKIILHYDNRIEDGIMYADFCVKDSGVGMSQDFQKHMFEPFTQEERSQRVTPLQGTGLGLPIVKGIVEKMGGTIRVESEKNKGTSFFVQFVIPLADSAQKQELEKQIQQEQIRGKTILVVEDYELNAMILCKILENAGANVQVATNGKEAVEQFAASEEKEIAAILMDVRMPVMDGYEATKTIRKLPRKDAGSVPIIAMTANAYEEDRKQSIAVGMNEHLIKPIDVDALCRTLYHSFI